MELESFSQKAERLFAGSDDLQPPPLLPPRPHNSTRNNNIPTVYDDDYSPPDDHPENEFRDPSYWQADPARDFHQTVASSSRVSQAQARSFPPGPQSSSPQAYVQSVAFGGSSQHVLRPTPIRPFVPLQPQVSSAPPVSFAPLRSLQPAPTQQRTAFPIPLNGNTNRRLDVHLRPDPPLSSRFQPGAGGNYTNSARPAPAQQERAMVTKPMAIAPYTDRMETDDDEEDYYGGAGDKAFENDLSNLDTAQLYEAYDARRPAPASAPPLEHQRHQRAPQSPPPRQAGPGGIRLRAVTELPDMYRSLWRFGVFNAVQSSCFETLPSPQVYQSDQNVVVAAPTGSGKTVIFELAILRALSTSTSNEDAKVLYMAPTKSLCQERAKDWKNKFAALRIGWGVIELTGDSASGEASLGSVGAAKIIITTPEKWDALTRRWHSHEKLLKKIKLFCIDECHFVGMDVRGAVLEVVVSRMKALGKVHFDLFSTKTRCIALSATAPNVEDIGAWMADDGQDAAVFKFSEDYRPCKLRKVVRGYASNTNDFIFNNSLTSKLFDLIKEFSSGKAVLIFCSTRKNCVQAAEALVKEYQTAVEKGRGNLPWPKPLRGSIGAVADKQLAALLESGIAFHHAGLDNLDRRAVEDAFIKGTISIVCATSTLAVGVNLPARMVIIKGTKQYLDGRFQEYTDLDIIQMIGRAGRPQFDTIGIAVIMTDKESERHYETLARSETLLESCLHKNLVEHINSEITLQTITTVAEALSWLESTFLFVRIIKSPAHYSMSADSSVSPQARLKEFVLDAVSQLVDSGVVDRDGDGLASTDLGDIMSRLYIQHATMLKLKALPLKASMRVHLETLSACWEFSGIRLRQGEKTVSVFWSERISDLPPYIHLGAESKVLAKQNKNLKFPCTKVATGADKVMIIIQSVLQGVPLSELKANDGNPVLDSLLIWQHVSRIGRCMVDIALDRRDGGVRTALELLRSLNAKAWEGTPFVLRQLEGIGEKSYKALSDKGISSFGDVIKAESNRLELVLNRNPPFGRKLIAQAKAIPCFTLELIDSAEDPMEEGVKVLLKLGVAMVSAPPAKKRMFASVLLVTSDTEYIELRRMRIEHFLQGPKSFSVSFFLVKPSQRVFITVACDEMAGTETKLIFRPSTDASLYPVPAIGIGQPERVETTANSDNDKPRPGRRQILAVTEKTKITKSVEPKVKRTEPEEPAPRKRSDGNFECNHPCADKTKCRHFCCRDGLAKPPTTRPKKSSTATQKAKKGSVHQSDSDSDGVRRHPAPAVQSKTRKLTAPRPLSKSAIKKATLITLSSSASEDSDNLPTLDELLATSKKFSGHDKRPNSPPPSSPRIVIDMDLDDEEIDELASPSPPPLQPRRARDSSSRKVPPFKRQKILSSDPPASSSISPTRSCAESPPSDATQLVLRSKEVSEESLEEDMTDNKLDEGKEVGTSSLTATSSVTLPGPEMIVDEKDDGGSGDDSEDEDFERWIRANVVVET